MEYRERRVCKAVRTLVIEVGDMTLGEVAWSRKMLDSAGDGLDRLKVLRKEPKALRLGESLGPGGGVGVGEWAGILRDRDEELLGVPPLGVVGCFLVGVDTPFFLGAAKERKKDQLSDSNWIWSNSDESGEYSSNAGSMRVSMRFSATRITNTRRISQLMLKEKRKIIRTIYRIYEFFQKVE